MSQRTKHTVPLPPNPLEIHFEEPQHNKFMNLINTGEGPIRVEVEGWKEFPKLIVRMHHPEFEETLWTAVHWAHKAGFPGVCKETLFIGDDYWRLGALYRYAGFQLTERESDYDKYGENQYNPETDEIGHGTEYGREIIKRLPDYDQ